MTRVFRLERAPTGTPWRIDYQSLLNEQQLEVVMAPGGPMLVIAGAGTGKTRTLTYRVARLIESGVDPERILLLTFTNRAAREMVFRVEQLLQQDAGRILGGTFHAVARRLLRDHATRLGYPDGFGILDAEDAQTLMKQCAAEVVRTVEDRRFPRPSVLLGVMSAIANNGRSIEEQLVAQYPQFVDQAADVGAALARFRQRKLEYGLMDFDDLLGNWHRLLVELPDVARDMAARFQHVLVDEYQDTNALQADLVERCAAVHNNLMVVGDDCQSIYSFRGAVFRNILEFPDRHPGCRICRLEISYRSAPEIVALANASIRHNTAQFEKTLVSTQQTGPLPAVIECADEREQNMFVAQRILELRDEGVPLERIAVLYRAHGQSLELQLELGRRGIPYLVRSGQRFFEQRHIKDLLAFLRVAENPRDELAFLRVAALADGIGTVTAQKLFLYTRSFDDLGAALASPDIDRIVPVRARPAWTRLRETLGRVSQPAFRRSASSAIDHVRNGFYDEYARRAYDNAPNRLREVDTLSAWADQQGSVDALLGSLALAGVIAGQDVVERSEAEECVVLTSIHQAKGLEFHAVFVVWLAEDHFPLLWTSDDPDAVEEERRLFYVAVTRAQRELYLTRPLMGFVRDSGMIALRASRFLEELSGESPPVFERWLLE